MLIPAIHQMIDYSVGRSKPTSTIYHFFDVGLKKIEKSEYQSVDEEEKGLTMPERMPCDAHPDGSDQRPESS
jgi:hypothetical protein